MAHGTVNAAHQVGQANTSGTETQGAVHSRPPLPVRAPNDWPNDRNVHRWAGMNTDTFENESEDRFEAGGGLPVRGFF